MFFVSSPNHTNREKKKSPNALEFHSFYNRLALTQFILIWIYCTVHGQSDPAITQILFYFFSIKINNLIHKLCGPFFSSAFTYNFSLSHIYIRDSISSTSSSLCFWLIIVSRLCFLYQLFSSKFKMLFFSLHYTLLY